MTVTRAESLTAPGSSEAAWPPALPWGSLAPGCPSCSTSHPERLAPVPTSPLPQTRARPRCSQNSQDFNGPSVTSLLKAIFQALPRGSGCQHCHPLSNWELEARRVRKGVPEQGMYQTLSTRRCQVVAVGLACRAGQGRGAQVV